MLLSTARRANEAREKSYDADRTRGTQGIPPYQRAAIRAEFVVAQVERVAHRQRLGG